MKHRIIGIFLILFSIVFLFFFEESNFVYIGGVIALIGFAMVTRPTQSRELLYPSAKPKTTNDLRQWGYYKKIHCFPSRENDPERKFRVVLETRLQRQHVFFMPEEPPKEFYWVNGRCITPNKIKEKQLKLSARM